MNDILFSYYQKKYSKAGFLTILYCLSGEIHPYDIVSSGKQWLLFQFSFHDSKRNPSILQKRRQNVQESSHTLKFYFIYVFLPSTNSFALSLHFFVLGCLASIHPINLMIISKRKTFYLYMCSHSTLGSSKMLSIQGTVSLSVCLSSTYPSISFSLSL